jgi:hypothetical protein
MPISPSEFNRICRSCEKSRTDAAKAAPIPRSCCNSSGFKLDLLFRYLSPSCGPPSRCYSLPSAIAAILPDGRPRTRYRMAMPPSSSTACSRPRSGACGSCLRSALETDRTSVRCRSSRPDDAAARARLCDLASVRRRFKHGNCICRLSEVSDGLSHGGGRHQGWRE